MRLIALFLLHLAAAADTSSSEDSPKITADLSEAEGHSGTQTPTPVLSPADGSDTEGSGTESGSEADPNFDHGLSRVIIKVSDDPDDTIIFVRRTPNLQLAESKDKLGMYYDLGRLKQLVCVIGAGNMRRMDKLLSRHLSQMKQEKMTISIQAPPPATLGVGQPWPYPPDILGVILMADPEEIFNLRLVCRKFHQIVDQQLSLLFRSSAFVTSPAFEEIFGSQFHPIRQASLLAMAINRTGWFAGRPGLTQDPERDQTIIKLASKIAEVTRNQAVEDHLPLFLCNTLASLDDLTAVSPHQGAIQAYQGRVWEEDKKIIKGFVAWFVASLLMFGLLIGMNMAGTPLQNIPWELNMGVLGGVSAIFLLFVIGFGVYKSRRF